MAGAWSTGRHRQPRRFIAAVFPCRRSHDGSLRSGDTASGLPHRYDPQIRQSLVRSRLHRRSLRLSVCGLVAHPGTSCRGVGGLALPGSAENVTKFLLIYALLLKATFTTFSGLASLPVLRHDLVLHYHLLTDAQLDTAVVVTRTTPGPVGVYIVSVGYFTDGVAGATAGWLAMISPAFVIIPLLRFMGSKAEHPRVKGLIQAVVLASAGLLWASTVPLTREVATDPFTVGLLVASALLLLTRKVETLWVLMAAGTLEWAANSFHLIRTS